MKEITHLIAEFKEAVIRGLVPPLDMSLVIAEMDRSLKYNFDEVFTHMSMDLEDAACDIFLAIKHSKESAMNTEPKREEHECPECGNDCGDLTRHTYDDIAVIWYFTCEKCGIDFGGDL